MSFDGFKPLLVPRLGGLVTYVKPVDVPAGFSPNLQNVRLIPRAVQTRPGLTARMTKASVTFFGLSQFIDNLGNKTLFTLDSNGSMDRQDSVTGNPDAVQANAFSASSFLRSHPAFSRNWMAGYADDLNSSAHAAPTGLLRYSNAQFDPVFPPARPDASATTAADAGAASTIAAPGASGAQEDSTGKIATITTTAAHGLGAGESVVIAGVTDTTFNGTFVVLTVVTVTSFEVLNNAPAALAVSGNGTVTPSVGSITAGLHSLAIALETTTGVLSQASITFTYTAAGGKQAVIRNMPAFPAFLGVTYFVAAWILMAPVGSTTYYSLPQWRIPLSALFQLSVGAIDGSDATIKQNGYDMTALLTAAMLPPMQHISPDGPGIAPTAADSATAGSIVAGVHQVQVVFETNFGYLTSPSPTASWTAAGAKKVTVSNILTGPWYVTARRLLFTAAAGADFFYVSATMRIPDNTTTSVTVDFTDTALLQGTNFNYLTKNFAMPEQSGVDSYNSRLAVWGGLNNIRGIGLNLGFDGGWLSNAPAGWTTASPTANLVREKLNAWAGEAVKLLGDGVSLQPVFISSANLPLIAQGTFYTVRLRAKVTQAGIAGNIGMQLQTNVGTEAFASSAANVNLSTFTTSFAQYEFPLTTPTPTGFDLTKTFLNVFLGNTPPAGQGIILDAIEIFPTASKYEASVVRFSNPFDPETFDGVSGLIQISKDDGQRVMSCVQLRNFYYIFKERSMHVTLDDGVNPPSGWLTRQVDATVGAASPNAVFSTESIVAIASRAGAYVFTGGRPTKVSQEIQTTWEKIDWSRSTEIFVTMDPQRKRIFYYVPMLGTTAPMSALVLDYSEGMGDEDNPAGRKWALDNYLQNLNAGIRLETSANQQTFYIGANRIYETVGTDDDGTAIDSFYETAFMKAGDRGQDLYGGVALTVEGAGTLTTSMKSLDDVTVVALQNSVLSAAPGKQFELYGNLESERVHVRCETNALGAFFTLKALTLYGMPWSEARPL